MKIQLTITDGPFQGQEFLQNEHDTFLVGRTKDAHFQLSYNDLTFRAAISSSRPTRRAVG